MIGGTAFSVVEPGTEIENPKTGEKLTVTDDSAVFLGFRAWVTQRTYDALKARSVPAPQQDSGER